MSARETARERIARLVREGVIPGSQVELAEAVWFEQLRSGVQAPFGEIVTPTIDDLFHLIVDPRVRRQPIRIRSAIEGIRELREAPLGRRLAVSQWVEGQSGSTDELHGVMILNANATIQSFHVVDLRRVTKYRRAHPVLLWPDQ
jgi:hypothetical protein